MRIQLFGERCSGTNYISHTIEFNSDAGFVSDYGYKHSPPVIGGRRPDLVIVVARNVFTWTRSLYCNPWGAEKTYEGMGFDEFLRTPWRAYYDAYAVDRDSELFGAEMMNERDEDGRAHANVMRMRSSKYRRWLAVGRLQEVVVCRLEDWQTDPQRELRKLETYGIKLKSSFTPVVHYKGLEKLGLYQPFEHEAVTDRQAEWIASQLDWDVERSLGYDSAS